MIFLRVKREDISKIKIRSMLKKFKVEWYPPPMPTVATLLEVSIERFEISLAELLIKLLKFKFNFKKLFKKRHHKVFNQLKKTIFKYFSAFIKFN